MRASPLSQFSAQGLEFSAQGLEFRAQRLGFRVYGFRGLGFRIWGTTNTKPSRCSEPLLPGRKDLRCPGMCDCVTLHEAFKLGSTWVAL